MKNFPRITLRYLSFDLSLAPRVQGLDRIAQIGDFNSRMAKNPRDVIELHNRIIENERQKKGLIETFTNQLYAYFLERKKQGEQKY